jgi:hypothetical protein
VIASNEVQVLVDLDETDTPVDEEFVRVILRREEGEASPEYATIEHHYLDPDAEKGSKPVRRRRTLLRGEPLLDHTAIGMAREFAAAHGIRFVYVRRIAWSDDDTTIVERPDFPS